MSVGVGELVGSRTPPFATLEIRGLHVSMLRGAQRNDVLKGLELEVHSGQITALVGRSGSGKSTLAHVIHGLLPRDSQPRISGSIRVVGEELVGTSEPNLRAARKSLVRIIPQDPFDALNPTMSVRAQMAEVCGELTAVERLRLAGIADTERVMGSLPHQLSGGERQRVLIAMTTAVPVPLIVADEPTTGLDLDNKRRVTALLRNLAAHGAAVLLSTHDLAVAEIADQTAILEDGRIVEVGPTSTIFARPRHPYSVGLLAIRYDGAVDKSAQLPTLARGDRAIDNSHFENIVQQSVPWAPFSSNREEVVLDMRRVSKAFRTRSLFRVSSYDVLAEIDLTVKAGECVALLGESGIGKSTLLKIAAGLLEQDRGTVRLDGRRPQLVFQDPKSFLTPWVPIGEQIVEGLRSAKVAKVPRDKRLAELMDFVDLERSLADALPSELSVGQCQRAAIARALAVSPRLLLCDEPISALDTSLAASMLNLLGRIRRIYGTAIVIATHDLAAARIAADRVYRIHDGKLLELADMSTSSRDDRCDPSGRDAELC